MRLLFALAVAVGLFLIMRSYSRWKHKQRGDANELEWLDELVREHLAGTHDHADTIRRIIHEVERGHTPSLALDRELRRAREALEVHPD